jgi:hypothetical protein
VRVDAGALEALAPACRELRLIDEDCEWYESRAATPAAVPAKTNGARLIRETPVAASGCERRSGGRSD